MENTNYRVTIKETSRELSPLERVKFKDTTDCVKLDAELDNVEAILVKVTAFVVLEVENDKAENKAYKNFVLVDENGTRYLTSSQTFFNTFLNIYDELRGCEEDWQLKIFKVPSKNYTGKKFITCSIA